MAGFIAAAAAATAPELFEEVFEEFESKVTPEAVAKAKHRLDADHFRGLRDEMQNPEGENALCLTRAVSLGHDVVTMAIFFNAVQMGAAIQFQGEPKLLWTVAEHVFTVIFTIEMLLKMYGWRWSYFYSPWNCLDCFVTCFSILSLWILASLNLDLESLQSLRLLKLMRLVRLLRVSPEVKVLVESLLASVRSLGWILVLLFLISYIFAIICCQVVEPELYKDVAFEPLFYFGDIPTAMLTLFNICILAEWGEIIRPISAKQPTVVVFVFIPYLALCTLGVLNLIIGVISEQTLAKAQAVRDAEEHARLRAKMKAIIRMTDEIYDSDDDGNLSKEEFMTAALAHPDFMGTLRQCNFPRGFEVKDLHTIFDDGAKGTIGKDEFINGMFRLVFNDLSQHAATLLLGISQVKHEVHDKMEVELDKIYTVLNKNNAMLNKNNTMLKERLPNMHAFQTCTDPEQVHERDPTMSEPPLKVQDLCMQPNISMDDDVNRMTAHIEKRLGTFLATFEQKALEAAQGVPTTPNTWSCPETAGAPEAPQAVLTAPTRLETALQSALIETV